MIAIIPARATSKRLPNKNFKQFFGRAIIDWALNEALKSEIFDRVVISTDTQEIPKSDAFDVYVRKNPTYEQTVDDVVKEVVDHYKADDYCVIYPTAYAVTAEHLLKGYGKFSFGMLNGEYKLDNGGFYYKGDLFLQGYEMPMVDINTMEDFIKAKLHAMTLTCGRFK